MICHENSKNKSYLFINESWFLMVNQLIHDGNKSWATKKPMGFILRCPWSLWGLAGARSQRGEWAGGLRSRPHTQISYGTTEPQNHPKIAIFNRNILDNHGSSCSKPKFLELQMLPSGYDIHSLPWYRWPLEIYGLSMNSMVDLSMANCECHNQRVTFWSKIVPSHEHPY